MAENSLSILLQTNSSAKDTLAEEWGKVIENLQKETIASQLKNQDLSGDPSAGVLNAKRFANAVAKAYGTARAGHAAEKVKALPVAIPIDDDREWLEEVEEKDLALYGVEGLISKRTANQGKSLEIYHERKFLNVAVLAGAVHTISSLNIEDKVEELIQKVEVVKNDFVDGVSRDMIALVVRPAIYGLIRNKLDGIQNANISSAIGEFGVFHGVLVFSSVFLPATVDYLVMAKGAVAQPIKLSILNPSPIQLSEATAFGAFTYSGTKAVMPDLIFFAGTLGSAVTLTTVYGGAANKSTITPTSTKSDSANKFYYLAHASAVASPAYGEAVGATWTELDDDGATITFATETKIRVAEADASGRIIKVSAETSIVKTNA